MSQVVLSLVTRSVLPGLCSPGGRLPFPWCTLGTTGPAACFFPRVSAATAGRGEAGSISNSAKFNCSCLSRNRILLIRSYTLQSTCVWCFQSSMCDVSHSDCHHPKYTAASRQTSQLGSDGRQAPHLRHLGMTELPNAGENCFLKNQKTSVLKSI